MSKYSFIVCGGTFDLFHKGHELFLKNTLELSDKVLIGITSNKYIQTFKDNLNIEDFEIRKKAVENYLELINKKENAIIVPIDNAFEPYLETSNDYDAIYVTPHTLKAAQNINIKRKENNISDLKIEITPFIKAEDDGIISSTRIRNGEINRQGKLYVNKDWLMKNLKLPDELRTNLQIPWGEIIKDIPENLDDRETVVVGDQCVKFFNSKNRNQFLSIVDFLIKREVKFNNLFDLGFSSDQAIKINNQSGIITCDLFNAVINIFKKDAVKNIILINGEDDLAVLPVILVAPLGFNIFYGQPNVGMVFLKVTEEIKDKAFKLINKFIIE